MSNNEKINQEEAVNENIGENVQENMEQESIELSNEEKLQQELNEANEKIAALEDKYIRQVAEFDNYRKRTMKERPNF